mgnify:CR=1 FL=1
MDAVLSCMVSDSLGPGTISRTLSSELAKYLDLAGGVALRDYHRAIECSCTALGLDRGAKVLISPLSPAAYFTVFAERAIEPVFADVDSSSPCVTEETVAAALAAVGSVDAVVIETTIGYSPILRELDVPIVEDVSRGLGGHNGHERNGSRGDVVIVGLEPDSIITAGGGAVVLAGKRKPHTALKAAVDSFGRELFLPDMNSALGLTQIKEIESFVAKRQEIAQMFSRAMMRSRHQTPVQPGDGENVFYSFPVLLRSGMKDVATYARKNGVESEPAFSDSILGRYGEIESVQGWDLPNAKAWLLRCVLFPLYPMLTKKDRELITRVLGTLP